MKRINDCLVYEFRSLENAKSFATKCKKAMLILMGDCPSYFVTTLVDGEKLIRGGYESVQTNVKN